MEEIVNLIGSDASALDVSDKIKDILFAKSFNAIQTTSDSTLSKGSFKFGYPPLQRTVPQRPPRCWSSPP